MRFPIKFEFVPQASTKHPVKTNLGKLQWRQRFNQVRAVTAKYNTLFEYQREGIMHSPKPKSNKDFVAFFEKKTKALAPVVNAIGNENTENSCQHCSPSRAAISSSLVKNRVQLFEKLITHEEAVEAQLKNIELQQLLLEKEKQIKTLQEQLNTSSSQSPPNFFISRLKREREETEAETESDEESQELYREEEEAKEVEDILYNLKEEIEVREKKIEYLELKAKTYRSKHHKTLSQITILRSPNGHSPARSSPLTRKPFNNSRLGNSSIEIEEVPPALEELEKESENIKNILQITENQLMLEINQAKHFHELLNDQTRRLSLSPQIKTFSPRSPHIDIHPISQTPSSLKLLLNPSLASPSNKRLQFVDDIEEIDSSDELTSSKDISINEDNDNDEDGYDSIEWETDTNLSDVDEEAPIQNSLFGTILPLISSECKNDKIEESIEIVLYDNSNSKDLMVLRESDELKRAKVEIQEYRKQMGEALHLVAQSEVEIARLQQRIMKKEKKISLLHHKISDQKLEQKQKKVNRQTKKLRKHIKKIKEQTEKTNDEILKLRKQIRNSISSLSLRVSQQFPTTDVISHIRESLGGCEDVLDDPLIFSEIIATPHTKLIINDIVDIRNVPSIDNMEVEKDEINKESVNDDQNPYKRQLRPRKKKAIVKTQASRSPLQDITKNLTQTPPKGNSLKYLFIMIYIYNYYNSYRI